MGRLNTKLRSVEGGIAHWCPGCDEPHVYQVPRWTFNGNIDRPSFTPSMKITWTEGGEEGHKKEHCCHYFLTDGRLQFCGDSIHALSGQTVDLPDWPKAHEFWNEERPNDAGDST